MNYAPEISIEMEGEDVTHFWDANTSISIEWTLDYPRLNSFLSSSITLFLDNSGGEFDTKNDNNFFVQNSLPKHGRKVKVILSLGFRGETLTQVFAGVIDEITLTLDDTRAKILVLDIGSTFRRGNVIDFGSEESGPDETGNYFTQISGSNNDYSKFNPVFSLPFNRFPVSIESVIDIDAINFVGAVEYATQLTVVPSRNTEGVLSNKNVEIDYENGKVIFEKEPRYQDADGDDYADSQSGANQALRATWKFIESYRRPDTLARLMIDNQGVSDDLTYDDLLQARFAIQEARVTRDYGEEVFSTHGRPNWHKNDGVVRYILYDAYSDPNVVTIYSDPDVARLLQKPTWYFLQDRDFVKYDEYQDEYTTLFTFPDETGGTDNIPYTAIQAATADFEIFYFLATPNYRGDAQNDYTRIFRYDSSTIPVAGLYTQVINNNPGETHDTSDIRPQLAFPYDFRVSMNLIAENRRAFRAVTVSGTTRIYFVYQEGAESGVAFYEEDLDDLNDEERAITKVWTANATSLAIDGVSVLSYDGLNYGVNFEIDIVEGQTPSTNPHLYVFICYDDQQASPDEYCGRLQVHKMDLNGDNPELIYFESFPSRNHPTAGITADTEFCPVLASDIILDTANDRWYFVLNANGPMTEDGSAILSRIDKDGMDDDERVSLKTYDNMLFAARSPAYRDAHLNIFDDYEKNNRNIYYLEGGWLNTMPNGIYPSDDEAGNLIEILVATEEIVDRGLAWRSETPDLQDDNTLVNDKHEGYGVHNAFISNMVQDRYNNLHFIAGFGAPYDLTTSFTGDDAELVSKTSDPIDKITNFNWVQWGCDLASKITSFPTNGANLWSLLEGLASLVDYEMGFGVDHALISSLKLEYPSLDNEFGLNANLFFRPRAIRSGHLQEDITSTSAELGFVNIASSYVKLPNEGFIIIDDEVIKYNAADDSDFGQDLGSSTTELERGFLGSTPASHEAGTAIYFIDMIAGSRGNFGTLVDVTSKQDDFQNIYNSINVPYGDAGNFVNVSSEDSIDEHGKVEFDVDGSLLDNHDRPWAEVLANQYCRELCDVKDLIEFTLIYSPELQLGNLILMHQEKRVGINYEKLRVLRVNHDTRTWQTKVLARTFPEIPNLIEVPSWRGNMDLDDVEPGDEFEYDFASQQPLTTEPLSFELGTPSAGSPDIDWVTLKGTVLSGTVPAGTETEGYEIPVIAFTQFGRATIMFILDAVASAPVWDAIPDQDWNTSTAVSVDIGSYVAGADSISLQSGTLPAGITFSNDTLSGTPTDASDDVTLTFRAMNDLGTADGTVAITISESPAWSTLATQSWIVDTAITNIDLNDLVMGDDTISITLQSGTLPDGITLAMGVVSGTPTDATQDGSVTFRATSSHGTDDIDLNYTISTIPSWSMLVGATWLVGTEITEIDLTDSVTGDGTIAITLQSGTLPDGISLSSGVLSGTPTDDSEDTTLTFRATSEYGTADTDLGITIYSIPSIDAISNISVSANGNVNVMVSISGDPTPEVTVEGLPTGVTYSNGVISGTTSVLGTYNVTITAMNSQGDDTETFDITVSAELTVPEITAINDISFAYNTEITAIDITVTGNPTPTVTVADLPAGLSYSGGEITGMSTATGTHEITVTATNSQGTDIETFDITIEAQLTVPQITAISNVSYNANQAITAITVTVTGNPTPSVSVTGLPTGITHSDGEITGMSTVAGVHEITITATNSQGTDIETFDITIVALTIPEITMISDASFAYNAEITAITVTVTGNPTPTVSVSGLPTGLTYASGEITGMSTAEGTHEVTVTAMNSQGTDTETFDLTIEAQLTAPEITMINDATFAYNTGITAITVTVTGNPTPTVSVSGLPMGLTYDSTDAEITGMSTDDGTHEITITATNSEGTDIETFDITIEEQPMSILTFGAISRQDVASGNEQTFGLSSYINQGNPPTNDFSIEIQAMTAPSLTHNVGGGAIIEAEVHIASRGSDGVYVYDLESTYLRQETLDSANGSPRGIAYNGNDEIYVVDVLDNLIYIYNTSYESQGTITLNSGNTQAEGLTYYNGNLYCVDRDGTVYPYSPSGTYQTSLEFDLDSVNSRPRGIVYRAGRFWCADIGGVIFAYRADGTYDSITNISTTLTNSQAIMIYNNQIALASGSGTFFRVQSLLDNVTVDINDSTQIVTIDSDMAWADHDIAVTVTAHQANFTDPTADFTIRLEGSIPVWTTLADVTWTADSAITDIDLNSMVAYQDSIALQSGTLPAGVTLTSGVLSGTPTDPTDDVTLTFRATNDAGTADATLAITIDGVAPSWTALSAVTWTEDEAITSIDLRDSVDGNPTPSIALFNSTLPSGITLSNGVVSGTPTNPDEDRTVTFRATNTEGMADTTLSITIDPAGIAPMISAIADVSEVYDEAITTITVTVTGDPTPTVTVAGLPSGVTYSGGQISGTTTVLGVHEVTVTATNNQGVATEEFDLTVSREMLFFINDSNNIAIARDLDGNLLSTYNLGLGTGDWSGGLDLADGFYVIDDANNDAIFYNLDRTTNSDRDITDLEARDWQGGLGLTDGFYVIDNSGNEARYYALDLGRNSQRDITLGDGDWHGGLSLTDGFYFIDNEDNKAVFYNLDRTADSTRDIDLGVGDWYDGTGISDGFYIINDTTNTAVFYNLDRTRDSDRDIDLGTGDWNGCVAVGIAGEAPAGAPVITEIGDTTWSFTPINVTVSGSPAPTISVTGLPEGLSYSNGQITGDEADSGTYSITIIATNSQGSATEEFDLTVTLQFIYVASVTDGFDHAYAMTLEGNRASGYDIEIDILQPIGGPSAGLAGAVRGGLSLTDGFYIIMDFGGTGTMAPGYARFFNLDRTYDASRDIDLGIAFHEGGFNLSDGFYIIERLGNTYGRFYNLDRTRDSSRDIDLGDGVFSGGLSLSDGFYFINFAGIVVFYNLDRTRDSSRDIDLGTGIWVGGFDLSDGMCFVDNTSDAIIFYNLDRTRDSSRDINLGDLGIDQPRGGFEVTLTG